MRLSILIILFALFYQPAVSAQDPAAMKGQANQQVAAAGQLTNNAFRLLQGVPSVENRKTALSLLVEAGRLFEQAAMTYKALVPQYAAQADVDNSMQAMQKCIQTISEIKASF